ncbi:hypothetical protein AMJ80_02455 [bacterium SM23_31]|nr:MAG: hypothetical protein AMJ80_02455 [bacterium SM23_31]
MADPVYVDCPADAWTKVATGITTGQLWRKKLGPVYLQTYRMTTNPANPAPTDQEDGVQIFTANNNIPISATAPIDVYIFPVGAAGRVRVDIP